MKIIENDNTIFFDVDSTLVEWEIPKEKEHLVQKFENYGIIENLVPHEIHINKLLQCKNRGMFIVVWSQNGYQWAKEVVEKLGLSEVVDLVMTKPNIFYDDLPIEEWSQRLWFKDSV